MLLDAESKPKIVVLDAFYGIKNTTKIDFGWASPQTPHWELTLLPQTLS